MIACGYPPLRRLAPLPDDGSDMRPHVIRRVLYNVLKYVRLIDTLRRDIGRRRRVLTAQRAPEARCLEKALVEKLIYR